MQLTYQESHFPFPLNASCVCTIGRFVIYMADWKLLQRVKMDLLMRKVKACTIIIFYICVLLHVPVYETLIGVLHVRLLK